MPLGLSSRHTYVSGCVRYNDLSYTVSQDDNLPASVEHSHFHEIDRGNLGYIGAVTWSTVSIAVCKHPYEQMIALSPSGEVKLFGSGKESEERISTPQGSPETRGHLRQVRTIANKTYAVGMGRQVYRREGEDHWVCLDQAIRPAMGEIKGFESIDGFSETDIHAVGWDGEIWHFDGNGWRERPSPTNNVLTRVHCAGDGFVYAAGRQGLLIRGRDERWDLVDLGSLREDIWDLAWFKDRLHVVTRTGLHTLLADKLVPVAFGDDSPRTCYQLSTADGVLWSFGGKDIMAFDGTAWTRID